MKKEEILKAKLILEERIRSLRNDFLLCSQNLVISGEKVQNAPFPILMYAFAAIDYFSSLWVGWNDPKGKNKKKNYNSDTRNHTDRIIEFMERYLNYPTNSSRIAVAIFRHKLMHTAEPRVITIKGKNERHYWGTDFNFNKKHLLPQKVNPDPNDPCYDHYEFWISIPQLISDIETGVFGPNGYFQDLIKDEDLQSKYKNCIEEFNSYEVEL